MPKRSRLALAGFTLFVLVGFVVFGSLSTVRQHANASIYIFADICECQTLEAHCSKDGTFLPYQNVDSDSSNSGLEYVSFFAGEYSCEQYSFQLFAYEFKDPSTAQKYFANITGKDSSGLATNFVLNSGIRFSYIATISGNNAYYIRFPSNAIAEVSQLLAACFTVKVY